MASIKGSEVNVEGGDEAGDEGGQHNQRRIWLESLERPYHPCRSLMASLPAWLIPTATATNTWRIQPSLLGHQCRTTLLMHIVSLWRSVSITSAQTNPPSLTLSFPIVSQYFIGHLFRNSCSSLLNGFPPQQRLEYSHEQRRIWAKPQHTLLRQVGRTSEPQYLVSDICVRGGLLED